MAARLPAAVKVAAVAGIATVETAEVIAVIEDRVRPGTAASHPALVALHVAAPARRVTARSEGTLNSEFKRVTMMNRAGQCAGPVFLWGEKQRQQLVQTLWQSPVPA